jgi:hypothetical protein
MYINDCGIPSKYKECGCSEPAISGNSCVILLECGQPIL